MIVLSTEVAPRRSCDIYNMESSYNWPIAHREGWPDLSGGEAAFYTAVQEFNARSRNIKIIFINQFGFSRKSCGRRMAEDIEFTDIRRASDVEFGQSIYEPFGIAQLESLTFGGICILSSVCGCVGFVQDVMETKNLRNIIIADYTDLQGEHFTDIEDMLLIHHGLRDRIESSTSEKTAAQICERLAANQADTEQMLDSGYRLAEKMSWDVVMKNYLLTNLEKTLNNQQQIEATAKM